MTKTELKQKLLFACMQNPALVHCTDPSTLITKESIAADWPDAASEAIIVALDTAEYIYENFGEEFDIDTEPEE